MARGIRRIDGKFGVLLALTVVTGLLLVRSPGAGADPVPSLAFDLNFSSTLGTASTAEAEAFDPADATLTGVATTSDLDVKATGGVNGGTVEIELEPEADLALHTGVYDIGTSPHEPTLTVYDGHTSTQALTDSVVDIRDLASDGTGKITRLDLTYVVGQDHAADSMFGEIRIGEPVAADHVDSATVMPWPLVQTGSTPVLASDWVHNTSSAPETIGMPALTGAGSDQFSIAHNGCSATLAPGASCPITVGFAPTAPGQYRPGLRFTVDGKPDVVALEAAAPAGFTGYVSTGGVFVNDGHTVDVTDGPYQLVATGGGRELDFYSTDVYGTDDRLAVFMTAPFRHTFTAGVHQLDRLDDSFYSLDPSVDGHTCNEFTGSEDIKRVSVDAYGRVTSLDLTFRGVCDQEASEMTGSLQYRVPISLTLTPSATVASGQRATLTGTAPPGAVLQVMRHSRTGTDYAASGTVTADVAGHYCYSLVARDDTRVYTRLNGVDSPSALVQARPAVTGPATRTVPKGTYTLTGTGAPRTSVLLHFHRATDPAGKYPVVRSVTVSAAGTWSRAYAAIVDYRIYASSTVNHTASPTVLIHAG